MSVLDSTDARGDRWMDTAFAKGCLGMLKRTNKESKKPWKQRTFCIFEQGLAYTSHKVEFMAVFCVRNRINLRSCCTNGYRVPIVQMTATLYMYMLGQDSVVAIALSLFLSDIHIVCVCVYDVRMCVCIHVCVYVRTYSMYVYSMYVSLILRQDT